MDESMVLEIGRDATWMLLLLSAPLLVVGTVVGVAIALLQALTTVQETTLTFMTTSLIEFTRHLFDLVVAGG
jgi:flagellar biosynthesis protein FliQ